jgi:hypothetical protein
MKFTMSDGVGDAVVDMGTRGHNDTPFGQPIPGRPVNRTGVGHSQGLFGVFSYYQLVISFFNIVPLISELT